MLVYECVMIMLMLCKSSYARLTPEVLQWGDVEVGCRAGLRRSSVDWWARFTVRFELKTKTEADDRSSGIQKPKLKPKTKKPIFRFGSAQFSVFGWKVPSLIGGCSRAHATFSAASSFSLALTLHAAGRYSQRTHVLSLELCPVFTDRGSIW